MGPQLQGPGWGEQTLPHAGVPRKETEALNSESVSWGFLSCCGFPTCEMERTGRGGV